MKYLSAFVLLLALMSFTSPEKSPEGNVSLKLKVTNLQAEGKNILVGIFKSGDDFPEGEASINKVIRPKGLTAQATWTDIPAGKYVVAVFQDLNGNGELDTNFFGVPKEPYGFSRNFEPSLSDRPTFGKCSTNLNEAQNSLEIKLID